MSQPILGLTPLLRETVLWEGVPDRAAFTWRMAGRWLAGWALWVLVSALAFVQDPQFPLAYWLGVHALVLALVGWAIADRVRAVPAALAHAAYAITNHRVVLRGGEGVPWTAAIALQDIRQVRVVRTLADRLRGTATLVLDARYPGPGGKQVQVPAQPPALTAARELPALVGLRDWRQAQAALAEALAGAQGRPPLPHLTLVTVSPQGA